MNAKVNSIYSFRVLHREFRSEKSEGRDWPRATDVKPTRSRFSTIRNLGMSLDRTKIHSLPEINQFKSDQFKCARQKSHYLHNPRYIKMCKAAGFSKFC